MRAQFLQVATRAQAIKSAPWALSIIKVDGGFMEKASLTWLFLPRRQTGSLSPIQRRAKVALRLKKRRQI